MPTKDDFNPDHRLPRFLAREPEQQALGKAWDRAVISSRVLKASIWAAAATALSVAILSVVGNPVTLLADVKTSIADVTASIADVTPSLANKSALQPDTHQSMPTIQSSADVQALPLAAKEVLAREENAASSEPTGQNQTENGEGLFRQFQAWAAEKDAQAQVGPVQSVQNAPAQVVQNAPAQVAEGSRASLRPMQKHRHVRPAHNARAEMRPVNNPRKKVRREQSSRIQDPRAQEARAQGQGQVVQNPQAPPFLQTFGWPN
jgi:hypothetical protein